MECALHLCCWFVVIRECKPVNLGFSNPDWQIWWLSTLLGLQLMSRALWSDCWGQENTNNKTSHQVAIAIDRGSTGSRGSFDPPLLEVGGQAMLFDPPLFLCVKIHHILLLCSVILLVVSFTCFQVRNNKNILSSLDWSSIRCFHWSVLTALQVQWLAAPLLFTLLLYNTE